ncbi:MAG: hypothetical protein QW160_04705 [Candidatus Bathyarchaeia archaeon]
MSFDPPPPVMAVAFGGYGIPQSDIVECRVHLGCTKEVSSFTLTLQNWNGKYSPNGAVPLSVGMDGTLSIGRGSRCPQIITCRIESLRYESKPTEYYVHVSGRCWGERLFRRVFTGVFENMKGEEIVKYLLDYYVGLSHNRGGTELVEATDTTYTRLEYENTPVWDIIRYIAETADKQGVIGFDFRVAPDGKFEFFPRNSKTSSVVLYDVIEEYEYRRDIFSVRNRVTVYGANQRMEPADGDACESLTGWNAIAGTLYLDNVDVKVGVYCVRCVANTSGYARFYRSFGRMRINDGCRLVFWCKSGAPLFTVKKVRIRAPDASNYFETNMAMDLNWTSNTLTLGESQTYDPNRNPNGVWQKVGNPTWFNVQAVEFYCYGASSSEVAAVIDGLHFYPTRFQATQEDTGSQSAYGLRELTETDEELYSDNECLLRAKALLDYGKSPTEHLTIKSTVVDYGDTPILAGDKVYVSLPNEGVGGYFRVESVEYHVDARTQTLEVTLELGREKPLLADYLYALKAKTEHLSRRKAPA